MAKKKTATIFYNPVKAGDIADTEPKYTRLEIQLMARILLLRQMRENGVTVIDGIRLEDIQ